MAEVAGSGDQTFAEVVLPDAIDHYARGEGIVFAGDPVGERLAASGGGSVDGGFGDGAAAERGEKSGRHLFGRTSVARRQIGFGGRVAADIVYARGEGTGLIVAEHLDQLLLDGMQLLLVFGLHGGRRRRTSAAPSVSAAAREGADN